MPLQRFVIRTCISKPSDKTSRVTFPHYTGFNFLAGTAGCEIRYCHCSITTILLFKLNGSPPTCDAREDSAQMLAMHQSIVSEILCEFASAVCRRMPFANTSAHAGSRTRVTSMGGLYDTATLHALLPFGFSIRVS